MDSTGASVASPVGKEVEMRMGFGLGLSSYPTQPMRISIRRPFIVYDAGSQELQEKRQNGSTSDEPHSFEIAKW
jgi:hypothetical protein